MSDIEKAHDAKEEVLVTAGFKKDGHVDETSVAWLYDVPREGTENVEVTVSF